jgi:hypothetical protein
MKSIFIFCALVCTLHLYSQQPADTIKHFIGERTGGGILFYLDESGKRGLIAAFHDQSDGISWGCSRKWIGADYLSDGVKNTLKIVQECGLSTAAGICWNLNIGGYNDWYLPSLDELVLLYKQRMIIGGFAAGDYCSSSEYIKGNNDCWALHFARNGMPFYYNKGSTYCVRGIRQFDASTTNSKKISSKLSNIKAAEKEDKIKFDKLKSASGIKEVEYPDFESVQIGDIIKLKYSSLLGDKCYGFVSEKVENNQVIFKTYSDDGTPQFYREKYKRIVKIVQE